MSAPSLTAHDAQHAHPTSRRQVGWAFIVAAGSWILYLIVAITLAADYDEALLDASEDLDTPANRLPAETLAEITHDHPWSVVTAVLLLFVPALLILATRRAAAVTGDRWGVRLAWIAAIVFWFYMLITFGLFADPQDLPPLTRDLDVLTVPFVSAGSVLSLLAFIGSAWRLHRHGWRRVASAVAAGVAGVLLVISVVASVGSGWDEPVPPVGLLPAELILGIALVVRRANRER
jgi:hypothetical protein